MQQKVTHSRAGERAQRCENCDNAEKLPPDPRSIGAPPMYECHGAPPSVLFVPAADRFGTQQMVPAAVFPMVPADWYCAAWRAREPQLSVVTS